MKNVNIFILCTSILLVNIQLCNSQTFDELLAKGHQFFLEQKFAEALNAYQHAATLDPLHPELYLRRGLTYRSLGESERFLQDFKKVQQLSPELLKSYLEGKQYFPNPIIGTNPGIRPYEEIIPYEQAESIND